MITLNLLPSTIDDDRILVFFVDEIIYNIGVLEKDKPDATSSIVNVSIFVCEPFMQETDDIKAD